MLQETKTVDHEHRIGSESRRVSSRAHDVSRNKCIYYEHRHSPVSLRHEQGLVRNREQNVNG